MGRSKGGALGEEAAGSDGPRSGMAFATLLMEEAMESENPRCSNGEIGKMSLLLYRALEWSKKEYFDFLLTHLRDCIDEEFVEHLTEAGVEFKPADYLTLAESTSQSFDRLCERIVMLIESHALDVGKREVREMLADTVDANKDKAERHLFAARICECLPSKKLAGKLLAAFCDSCFSDDDALELIGDVASRDFFHDIDGKMEQLVKQLPESIRTDAAATIREYQESAERDASDADSDGDLAGFVTKGDRDSDADSKDAYDLPSDEDVLPDADGTDSDSDSDASSDAGSGAAERSGDEEGESRHRGSGGSGSDSDSDGDGDSDSSGDDFSGGGALAGGQRGSRFRIDSDESGGDDDAGGGGAGPLKVRNSVGDGESDEDEAPIRVRRGPGADGTDGAEDGALLPRYAYVDEDGGGEAGPSSVGLGRKRQRDEDRDGDEERRRKKKKKKKGKKRKKSGGR